MFHIVLNTLFRLRKATFQFISEIAIMKIMEYSQKNNIILLLFFCF